MPFCGVLLCKNINEKTTVRKMHVVCAQIETDRQFDRQLYIRQRSRHEQTHKDLKFSFPEWWLTKFPRPDSTSCACGLTMPLSCSPLSPIIILYNDFCVYYARIEEGGVGWYREQIKVPALSIYPVTRIVQWLIWRGCRGSSSYLAIGGSLIWRSLLVR